jgi:hypothetical protein
MPRRTPVAVAAHPQVRLRPGMMAPANRAVLLLPVVAMVVVVVMVRSMQEMAESLPVVVVVVENVHVVLRLMEDQVRMGVWS